MLFNCVARAWPPGVTLAKSLTIKVGPGYAGIHDRDAEKMVLERTTPHWPTNMMPATGSEDHADTIQSH